MPGRKMLVFFRGYAFSGGSTLQKPMLMKLEVAKLFSKDFFFKSVKWMNFMGIYFASSTPPRMPVTTRIMTCWVGNPNLNLYLRLKTGKRWTIRWMLKCHCHWVGGYIQNVRYILLRNETALTTFCRSVCTVHLMGGAGASESVSQYLAQL